MRNLWKTIIQFHIYSNKNILYRWVKPSIFFYFFWGPEAKPLSPKKKEKRKKKKKERKRKKRKRKEKQPTTHPLIQNLKFFPSFFLPHAHPKNLFSPLSHPKAYFLPSPTLKPIFSPLPP